MTARADDQSGARALVDGKADSKGERKGGGFDFDVLKLVLVALLLGAGVYGNWRFGDYSVLYRALALTALAAGCAAITVSTASGRAMWSLVKEARSELRRVVFPSRDETLQTTGIVVLVVVLIALLLWLLDLVFGAIISKLIG